MRRMVVVRGEEEEEPERNEERGDMLIEGEGDESI
jgi:hypothetical protein